MGNRRALVSATAKINPASPAPVATSSASAICPGNAQMNALVARLCPRSNPLERANVPKPMKLAPRTAPGAPKPVRTPARNAARLSASSPSDSLMSSIFSRLDPRFYFHACQSGLCHHLRNARAPAGGRACLGPAPRPGAGPALSGRPLASRQALRHRQRRQHPGGHGPAGSFLASPSARIFRQ